MDKRQGEYKGLRILLVEDNTLHQNITSRFLKKIDLEPDITSTGEEALSILEENSYDVIFLDINLPGVSGMEVMKAIREREAAQSKEKGENFVVAITGTHGESFREECIRAGFDDFLTKPISLREFHRVLGRVLAKKELGDFV